jgi:hypothetical protein
MWWPLAQVSLHLRRSTHVRAAVTLQNFASVAVTPDLQAVKLAVSITTSVPVPDVVSIIMCAAIGVHSYIVLAGQEGILPGQESHAGAGSLFSYQYHPPPAAVVDRLIDETHTQQHTPIITSPIIIVLSGAGGPSICSLPSVSFLSFPIKISRDL